jgi:hypothetical protein
MSSFFIFQFFKGGILVFSFTLYKYYTKIFLKNQSNPPHGKPHSIIRVAGIFREKKVLHPLFCFRVGIILSKSHLDFIVSVPVNVFLLKYRAKRVKMMHFC